MAISTQISRLMSLRDAIRTKMIGLGILPAASSSATLSQCYDALSGVTALGAMSYTPTMTAQTIPSGRYLSGTQTIEAIPSAYIIPTGTIQLSSSGTYDVGSYASAEVTAAGGISEPYFITVTDSDGFKTRIYYNGSESCISSYAFAGIYNTIYNYTNSRSDSEAVKFLAIENADAITTIDQYAFYKCSIFGSGTAHGGSGYPFPDAFPNLEYIGSFAYANASMAHRLEWASVPKLKSIGEWAFDYAVMWSASSNQMTNRSITFSYLSTAGEGAFACAKWFSISSASMAFYSTPKGIGAFYNYTSDIRFPVLPLVPSFFMMFGNYFSSSANTKTLIFDAASEISKYAFYANNQIKSVSIPECSYIGYGAFAGCTKLSTIYGPKVVSISDYAFGSGTTYYYYSTGALSTVSTVHVSHCGASSVNFPILSVLSGLNVFQSDIDLKSVSMPSLRVLSGTKVFYGCGNLSSLEFPALEEIRGSSHFINCTKLSSVSFPNLKTISEAGGPSYGLFQSCSTSLSGFDFPELLTLYGNGTFKNNSYYTHFIFPKLTSIMANDMFYSCTNAGLTSFNFPNLTTISANNTFYNCNKVIEFNFPNLVTIRGNATFALCSALKEMDLRKYEYTSATISMLQSCYQLSTVRFSAASMLSGGSMFRYDSRLISMFFTGSSLCALGNSINAMFLSTPVSTYSTVAGRYASIFVPSSLLATYKAATNWTTISSKIFAYEDYFGPIT